jgi:hypothetical protein
MLDARRADGSIKSEDAKVSAVTRIVGYTSSVLAGKVGRCGYPSATVKINTSYGSVRLY